MRVNHRIILLWSSIVVLLGYILTCFLIFPYADDFSYALRGESPDLLQTILNEREIWNGRYLSNFIIVAYPLNWGGLWGYRLMAIVLIIGSWLVINLGLKKLDIKRTILISSVTLCLICWSHPNVTEAFYWLPGAWTYVPPSLLLFV